MKFRRSHWLVSALLLSWPISAKTRLTIVNATGYDSNFNNTPSPTYAAGLNDTKIFTGKKLHYGNHWYFSLNGSLSSAYRQSGTPSNAQVVQMLPRANVGVFWLPGFLKSLDFKVGLDLNYSHKFSPAFRNNPVDDQTNLVNNSEDDGSHTLEQDNHSLDTSSDHADTGSSDHHASDSQSADTHLESADNDVDDDFDDPDFVGQGSGQSYATLKSFTRSTYTNNYSSRLSFFITPWSDWELRFSGIISLNDVGPQPGLLSASSKAHAYEVALSHELIEHLELSFTYQIEFRKFGERPAFAGSTDLFFVRTHQLPVELTWYMGHHMRLIAAYS